MSKENRSTASGKKGGNIKGNHTKKTSSKKPQTEAEKRTRKIAMNRKSELTIHGRDGRIQDKSSNLH